VRFESVRTDYAVVADSIVEPTLAHAERLPLFTVDAEGARVLDGEDTELAAGGAFVLADGHPYGNAHGRLTWRAHRDWTLSGRARFAHQFVQSMRNPESVTAVIFPVDLPVAGRLDGAVPIGRGTWVGLNAAWRPEASLRLVVEAFARHADDLVLVAPRAGGPFATTAFVSGRLEARGASIEAAFRTARLGATMSLAFERVRLEHGDSAFAPQYASARRLQGGIIVFPSAPTSIRLGVVAASGRRATLTRGTFEWESCNLLDRGCEFAGRPDQGGDPLGGEDLPTYVRVDLGVRRHWHVGLGSREAVVGAFATWSNLFDRSNLLTRLSNDAADRQPIEMRPSGPLVLGFDARF
jgi:hypothetical protein